jgi:hypothetical protein
MFSEILSVLGNATLLHQQVGLQVDFWGWWKFLWSLP